MGQAKVGVKKQREEQAQQRSADLAERLGIEKRLLVEINAELGLP